MTHFHLWFIYLCIYLLALFIYFYFVESQIPRDKQQRFESLRDLISDANGSEELRQRIAASHPPSVPFIGEHFNGQFIFK
jgi:hypothetical protein